MALWFILNKDNVAEDMDTIQQTNKDFIFPADSSSSDIAIQTLHALAHTSFIKRESPSDIHSSHSPYSRRTPSSKSSYSDRVHPYQRSPPPPPSTPLSSSSSNFSRREYKKKELVIRPELMQMKQAKAAVKLGIPPSTFSKRWRESLPERKWPYRIHKKVEKSIQMLKVLQQKGHDVTLDLKRLMTQRELNLKPATITMFEDVNENIELDPIPSSTPSSGNSSEAEDDLPTPSPPSESPRDILQEKHEEEENSIDDEDDTRSSSSRYFPLTLIVLFICVGFLLFISL